MIDSFPTGFMTPIIKHQMRAEGGFDCAKYSDSEQSLRTNSFQVALPKGMGKKARGFVLTSHSREVKNM